MFTVAVAASRFTYQALPRLSSLNGLHYAVYCTVVILGFLKPYVAPPARDKGIRDGVRILIAAYNMQPTQ